ncbi:hypothetical protein MTR67_046752 [Solanum verrucosum]|uniref:Uncharacterized protein n=1 Tax=Solanum verrucosum TaxID=315347 RepID=A0AAF0UVT8_SOLVR|nr:hypothetical protein MTR67_046752 [Solanum verrucosum]
METTLQGGPMVWVWAWDFHVGGFKFKTPCQRKQEFVFWVELVAPGLPSVGYLSYVEAHEEAEFIELGVCSVQSKSKMCVKIMRRALLLLCRNRYGFSQRAKAFNEDVMKLKVEAMPSRHSSKCK